MFSGNIQINIFALLMLTVLFFNVFRRSKSLLPDEKMFLEIVAADAIILIADSVQWMIDGQPGFLLTGLNTAASIVYYILTPVPCLLWCYYVRYQFSMDEKDTKAKLFLSVPAVVSAVISVASAFTGWFFSIGPGNRYQRGSFFWVLLLIVFGYLIYAFVYTFAKRKNLDRTIFLSLISFAVIPFVAGVVQALYYGLSLVWPCVALALLIIYIYIQNSRLFTDHLTGLYNRRQLDIYLDEYLKKGKAGLGGIMLDIDNFKLINDTHGHTIGDQAIMHAASILKKSIRKNGFLARFGGDEFVVLTPAHSLADVELVVKAIQSGADAHNKHAQTPYEIHFSVGYDVFMPNSAASREQILSRIDALMYDNKQSRKALE